MPKIIYIWKPHASRTLSHQQHTRKRQIDKMWNSENYFSHIIRQLNITLFFVVVMYYLHFTWKRKTNKKKRNNNNKMTPRGYILVVLFIWITILYVKGKINDKELFFLSITFINKNKLTTTKIWQKCHSFFFCYSFFSHNKTTLYVLFACNPLYMNMTIRVKIPLTIQFWALWLFSHKKEEKQEVQCIWSNNRPFLSGFFHYYPDYMDGSILDQIDF